ncbi:hypothetical protein [Thermococcus sp.]
MEAFRCERCNAPLEVSPETIVAICQYCGYPNHISGNLHAENLYIVPSLSKNDIYKAFMDRIEKDFDLKRIKNEIQVVDMEGVYVPYWGGLVYVEGEIEYMVKETECHTYTDSDGEEHEECREVERYYHDFISESFYLMGPARRQVGTFGIDEVMRHYRGNMAQIKSKKLLELDEDEWQKIKLEILNTEFDERQAKMMMKEDAIDRIRERYKAKADRIDFFKCEAKEPENVRLILLPVWTVYYKYGNSIYKVIFAGWDGKDVAATEPMTMLRKAQYIGGIIGGILISGIGTLFFVSQGSEPVSIVPIIVGAVISAGSGFMFLKGERVER